MQALELLRRGQWPSSSGAWKGGDVLESTTWRSCSMPWTTYWRPWISRSMRASWFRIAANAVLNRLDQRYRSEVTASALPAIGNMVIKTANNGPTITTRDSEKRLMRRIIVANKATPVVAAVTFTRSRGRCPISIEIAARSIRNSRIGIAAENGQAIHDGTAKTA